MDVELNKRNARRVLEEAFGQGRLDVVDECIAPDAVDRHPFTDEAPNFPAHMKQIITMLRSAMPDLTMRVDDVVGERDRVAIRATLTGTHTGEPLLGIPASGHAVKVEQFHFVQCDEAGRGVLHWANVGEREILEQAAGTAVAG